jgi:hypothetical protein
MPIGPAAGLIAAKAMSLCGATVAAGSAYAAVQSAAMGGQGGTLAAVGGMSAGTAAVAVAVAPVAGYYGYRATQQYWRARHEGPQ